MGRGFFAKVLLRAARQQGIAQVDCAAHFEHRNINNSQFTSECITMHHGSTADIPCHVLHFLTEGLSLNTFCVRTRNEHQTGEQQHLLLALSFPHVCSISSLSSPLSDFLV
jgi:hypothetical protein